MSMKRFLAFMLCSSFFALVSAQEKQENLINNSSFEKVSQDGIPEGWASHLKAISVVQGVSDDGSASMKISCVSPADKSFKGNAAQTIKKLEPGQYVLASSFKGDADALWIVLIFKDKDGKETGKFNQWLGKNKFTAAGNPEWFRFMWKFTVPENTTSGVFVIEVFGADNQKYMNFDNASLMKTE